MMVLKSIKLAVIYRKNDYLHLDSEYCRRDCEVEDVITEHRTGVERLIFAQHRQATAVTAAVMVCQAMNFASTHTPGI